MYSYERQIQPWQLDVLVVRSIFPKFSGCEKKTQYKELKPQNYVNPRG